MHLSKRVGFLFLTLSIVLLIIILWPSSRAELHSNHYQLSSSSEFVSALDKAETFSFSHLDIIQDDSIRVAVSPRVTGQTLAAVGGYDYQSQVFSYVVQSGDTITQLADRFNISRETIIWANELEGRSLKEGDALMILPVSGALHLVRPNETLGQIARNYKVGESEILSFNQISDANAIFVGDLLVVPGGRKPAQPGIATTQPVASSYFIRPTTGRISQGLHPYNAIDIANSCETPIYAAAVGTIQLTGYHSVGGNYVRISHPNGVVTYYGHLSRISVVRGQSVAQGQEIGRMGTTGLSTGCHLHFEVRGAANPLAGYRVGAQISF